MNILDAVILGLIQGITEFLPISSSGHLVLFESLLGLDVENLKSFDVAVHMGTLLAILIYFWKDFWGIILGIFTKTKQDLPIHGLSTSQQSLMKKFVGSKSEISHNDARSSEKHTFYRKLFGYLIVGMIPAVIAGVFLEDAIDHFFRNSKMVALMMILVGFVFFLAERFPRRKEYLLSVFPMRKGIRIAFIIGLAQAVALIPGISRSGSTISAGLFQGLKREESARFAFLLGAPAIFGAGLWTALQNFGDSSFALSGSLFMAGFISAAFSGLAAVKFLMYFLKRHSLYWFGAYLILAGLFFFLKT